MGTCIAKTLRGEATDQDLSVRLEENHVGHVPEAEQHRRHLAALAEGLVRGPVAVISDDGDFIGRVAGDAGAPGYDNLAVGLDGHGIRVVISGGDRRAHNAARAEVRIESAVGQVPQDAEYL